MTVKKKRLQLEEEKGRLGADSCIRYPSDEPNRCNQKPPKHFRVGWMDGMLLSATALLARKTHAPPVFLLCFVGLNLTEATNKLVA